MKRRIGPALIGLAVLVGAALCQSAPHAQDPSWRAPEKAASRVNPLAGHPEAVAGGRKLFLRNCAECHGEDGRGVKRHAADLRLGVVHRQSDGTLFWKITNGNLRRGMPSFSRLPALQRWQLVLFLRTLERPD